MKYFIFQENGVNKVPSVFSPQVLCPCNRILESKSRLEETSRDHLIQPFAQNIRFLRYMSPSTGILQPLWTMFKYCLPVLKHGMVKACSLLEFSTFKLFSDLLFGFCQLQHHASLCHDPGTSGLSFTEKPLHFLSWALLSIN